MVLNIFSCPFKGTVRTLTVPLGCWFCLQTSCLGPQNYAVYSNNNCFWVLWDRVKHSSSTSPPWSPHPKPPHHQDNARTHLWLDWQRTKASLLAPFTSTWASVWRLDLRTPPVNTLIQITFGHNLLLSLVVGERKLPSLYVRTAIELPAHISVHGMSNKTCMFHLDDNPLFQLQKSAENWILFDKGPHEHGCVKIRPDGAKRTQDLGSTNHRALVSNPIDFPPSPLRSLVVIFCVHCGNAVGPTAGEGTGRNV